MASTRKKIQTRRLYVNNKIIIRINVAKMFHSMTHISLHATVFIHHWSHN